MDQQIRFMTTPEGARIAYATVGQGPVLIHTAHWLSHLEFDWQDEAKRSFYESLARKHTLVRYDKHGCGLSDRNRTEISLESEVQVLEALIDHLAPDRFALIGISQAGPIALSYAVRNPERVSHLILYGTYSNGAKIAADDLKKSMLSLVRANWGIGSKALADIFMPGSDAAAVESFAKSQRKAATAEMAGDLLDLTYRIDVTDLLARVQVPTIVIHRDGDRIMPFHLGRELASSIADARLVPLAGRIHLPWLGDADSVLSAIGEFLGDSEETATPGTPGHPAKEPTPFTAAKEASAGTGARSNGDVYDLIGSLDVVVLSRYRVVGDYMRFDEVVRNTLTDARQKISAGLKSQGRTRENHLIWAAPGTGKTYFVEQVAASLPASIRYLELNLAKHDQRGFLAGLGELDDSANPSLCFVDEIDAKPDEAWPYESLLPYLDAAAQGGAPLVFVLAGSGGASIEELKKLIAQRPKGTDLLSRIPSGNEYEIAPLGVFDRVLVALSQIRQLGREAQRDIRAVEKLGLCYVALSSRLANARQLREFAARAVQRIEAGEHRIKYDDLFSAGDPENKEFWLQAGPAAIELANRFVTLEE